MEKFPIVDYSLLNYYTFVIQCETQAHTHKGVFLSFFLSVFIYFTQGDAL